MPFKNAHFLYRVGGHFGQSSTIVDTWSVGLRFGSENADVAEITEAGAVTLLESAYTSTAAFHSTTDVAAGQYCFLTWQTLARIGSDGRYNPDTQETARRDFTPVAGGSITRMPYNTANVISLRTERPRGYASNGRVYYPATGATLVETTGRVSAALVLSRLNAAKTWIDALNNVFDDIASEIQLCVFSKAGSGVTARVTSLRSDNRLDSIERRENDAAPAYQSVDLAP